MNVFQKSFRLSVDDHFAFQAYHWRRSRFVVDALFFVFMWVNLVIKNGSWFSPFVIVTAILFAVGGRLISSFLMLLQIKSRFRSSQLLDKEFAYIFSPEGFEVTHAQSSSAIKWSGIQKLGRSKKYLYIYLDNLLAYILPLREFSEEEFAGIQSYAQK